MAGSPPNAPPAPFDKHPSYSELIESHLRPWVASGEKAGEFIHDHEADLYATGPDDLTSELPPATAGDGQEAWYFFTTLKVSGNLEDRMRRTVNTGEGYWNKSSPPKPVLSDHGNSPQEIGQRETLSFRRMENGEMVSSGWLMAVLRLNPSDEHVLCKVYRSTGDAKSKAGDGSPAAAMAGPPAREKADAEASAAAGVAAPRREEDDEEIDAEMEASAEEDDEEIHAEMEASAEEDDEEIDAAAEEIDAAAEEIDAGMEAPAEEDDEEIDAEMEASAEEIDVEMEAPAEEDDEEIDAEMHASAAGSRLKRKAGDKDPGAETAAAPPVRQKKFIGESAGAATTGELCGESRASVGAAEEVEAPAEPEGVEAAAETEEPKDPSKPRLHNF